VQKLEPSAPPKNPWNIPNQAPATVPEVVVEAVELPPAAPVVAEPPKPVKNPWNVLPKPTPVPIGVVEEEVKAEVPVQKVEAPAPKVEAPAQKTEPKVVKSVWAAPPKKADNGADAKETRPRKSSISEPTNDTKELRLEAEPKENVWNRPRKNSYQDPAFEEADKTHVSQSSKMTRRAQAEPAPVVWDGKRVIEQASIPPPQTQERRKSASEITTAPASKPNKANKTPKSQPLQPTARTALAPVLELDAEEAKSKPATKGDEWQVVDMKPRGRSSTISGDQPPLPLPASGVAVSEKPQKGTQSRSASAQPTRSVSPAPTSAMPPVQATTPAISAAQSEPSPTPAVVQQQQAKPEPAQPHVQAQKKKKDAKAITKPKRTATTMPTTHTPTPTSTQATNNTTNNALGPQVYIAGGALALVSIVSYYLFM
jgi:hypothetical protein